MPGMARGFEVNILDTLAIKTLLENLLQQHATSRSSRVLVVKLLIQIWRRKEVLHLGTDCKKLGTTSFVARNNVKTNQLWTVEIMFGPEMPQGRT